MINSPLEQFSISKITIAFKAFEFFGVTFSTYTLFSIIFVVLFAGLMVFGLIKPRVVPSLLQLLIEELYTFVYSLVVDTLGVKHARFFPGIFFIFITILMFNLFGLFPYGFTVTSQIITVCFLSFSTFIGVLLLGVTKHKLNVLSLFFPSGAPISLAWLLVIIELVSFFSRPFSLAIRLFANLTAGHVLLKILAGFVLYAFFLSISFLWVPFTQDGFEGCQFVNYKLVIGSLTTITYLPFTQVDLMEMCKIEQWLDAFEAFAPSFSFNLDGTPVDLTRNLGGQINVNYNTPSIKPFINDCLHDIKLHPARQFKVPVNPDSDIIEFAKNLPKVKGPLNYSLYLVLNDMYPSLLSTVNSSSTDISKKAIDFNKILIEVKECLDYQLMISVFTDVAEAAKTTSKFIKVIECMNHMEAVRATADMLNRMADCMACMEAQKHAQNYNQVAGSIMPVVNFPSIPSDFGTIQKTYFVENLSNGFLTINLNAFVLLLVRGVTLSMLCLIALLLTTIVAIFLILELFVAVLQAYVFSILSTIYIRDVLETH